MADQRRILMVLTGHTRLGDTGRTTGFHVAEAAYPWEAFTRAGYGVDFVTPNAAAPTADAVDRPDDVQRRFLDDAGVTAGLADPLRPLEVEAGRYDAVFYVGGHGTMWDFPQDTTLTAIARDIYEGGGVVAAICHGPAGLLEITLSDGHYLVDGKRLTSFTDSEERAVGAADAVPFLLESALVERGADFVVDGLLVTGQNPASAPGTADAVLSVLGSRVTA